MRICMRDIFKSKRYLINIQKRYLEIKEISLHYFNSGLVSEAVTSNFRLGNSKWILVKYNLTY